MRPADWIPGTPLRAALLALVVFFALLLLTGTVLHRLVAATMSGELRTEIDAEMRLLVQIGEGGGRGFLPAPAPALLVQAIAGMNSSVGVGPRLAALFDANGRPLAGPLDRVPARPEWQVFRVSVPTGADEIYLARVHHLAGLTLVVGRSRRLIERVLDALAGYLALAGITVALAGLAIGTLFARRAGTKLDRMATTLDRVSRGELAARLPVGAALDPIDRVSVRMNGHLDELSRLVADARGTVQAIAHDLRTPLNRASLKLQEAAAAVDEDAPAASLIEAAGGQIDALGEILETVLRIGRIRSSDDRAADERFDAHALLEEIAAIYEPVFEAGGQCLTMEPGSGSAAFVRGDRRMVRQMLVNLVENARRHCPRGTTVVLSAAAAPGTGVRLVVADDGPGIPVGARQAVLEPFRRLDPSRSSEGAGLGLALVDAVVRRHGAALALEDAGPGLRARVDFP